MPPTTQNGRGGKGGRGRRDQSTAIATGGNNLRTRSVKRVLLPLRLPRKTFQLAVTSKLSEEKAAEKLWKSQIDAPGSTTGKQCIPLAACLCSQHCCTCCCCSLGTCSRRRRRCPATATPPRAAPRPAAPRESSSPTPATAAAPAPAPREAGAAGPGASTAGARRDSPASGGAGARPGIPARLAYSHSSKLLPPL